MQSFWFVLIAILWAGFFALEGFDFGVGLLLPFVGRTDTERRIALRTIGPVWDGNEVWLIVAGAAMFAAFPEWYASVFSGFYLAFALLLVGLILRGIGIEYRGKAIGDLGRRWCDIAIVLGSFLPALLLGVAFADFVRGVDMNSGHVVTGSFLALLSPYALLGGLVSLTLFALHGAALISLRTDGPVRAAARHAAGLLGPLAVVSAVVFLLWSAGGRSDATSDTVGVLLVVGLCYSLRAQSLAHDARAFLGTTMSVLLFPVWTFVTLWPDVLPARNDAANSLTIHNASSGHYTLVVMAVVALVFTPLVVAYQAWAYWVFRARVTGADVAVTYPDTPLGRGIAKAQSSMHATLGTTPRDPAAR